VSLRIPSSSRSPDHDPHCTIYYFRYPLGRFAGLKHRQLACQVGVIITTWRIRRTLVNKINLLVDSPRSIEASRLAPVKAESIFLRRASGCFGTSRGSSCRSSLTTPRRSARLAARRAARRRLLRLAQARRQLLRLLRASGCLSTSRGSSRSSSCRSSSTTPRRAGSSSTTPPRTGSSSTTSPPPRVLVPRHVARLVTWLVAPLVVDYSASRRLVVDYFASTMRGCLGTSRGSSRGSSRRPLSTTSTTPCIRVPRHVARLVTRLVTPLVVDYSTSRRLVVDYFTSAARPGASAHRAARHTALRQLLRLAQAHRRLLCLHRASGCLGTSRGSSRGSSRRSPSTTPPRAVSSSTTPPPSHVRVPRHVARLVTRLVALLVIDYSASRRLVVDYFASATHPGASARRPARHAARRAARRRLLRVA
jgi:hypothetical protein